MTNWEKIKSMTDEEFGQWLCNCIIPDDQDEEMFLMQFGRFLWMEDVIDMLQSDYKE